MSDGEMIAAKRDERKRESCRRKSGSAEEKEDRTLL
jgi:hypothetical protein